MGEITEKRRRDYSGLDADKASIPAGGKAVNDTFLATDTKTLYFWDGVSWIDVQIVLTAKAELGFGRYVPRAVAAVDFTIVDFTVDSAWHVDGLNLSGILPAGALAAHMRLNLLNNVANTPGSVRGNATTKVENKLTAMSHVAGIICEKQGVVFVDSNRLLDYTFVTGIDAINLYVLGWYI